MMLSDNGTQFVGAEKKLKEMVKGWKLDELREFCAEKGMKWRFTTPKAPHHNGCAEALVKTCKKALKKAIGNQVLSPFELYTYLLEVANLVIQDLLAEYRMILMMESTSVQMTYCLAVQRQKFHKDRLDKPKTQDTELSLLRNWSIHFGESGAEMFSRH